MRKQRIGKLFIFLLTIGLFLPRVASAEDGVSNEDILNELKEIEKENKKIKEEIRELKEDFEEKEEAENLGVVKGIDFIALVEFYSFFHGDQIFSGLTFGIENDTNRDYFSFERFFFTVGFGVAEVEHIKKADLPEGVYYRNIREFFLRFSGDWMLLKFNNYDDVEHDYQRLSFGMGIGFSFAVSMEYTTSGIDMSDLELFLPDTDLDFIMPGIELDDAYGIELVAVATLAYAEILARCGADFEFDSTFCSGGFGINW